MKNLIVLMVAICIAPPCAAQEPKEEECKKVSEFSWIVMQNRQLGIPLVDIMERWGTAGKDIILLAYDTPRQDRDARDAAAADFRDAMVVACYRDEISIDVSRLP
jgi:hypothetical protein